MEKRRDKGLEKRNEELNDLLEDLLTLVQEIREEFTSALDDLEDMIAEALQIVK